MGRTEVATFGGGCFWGVDALFAGIEGVLGTQSGYMGGHVREVTYRQVCSGESGHAEVVQVTFDPEVVAYEELLHVFWEIHDPTTRNRQGPDFGSQYRSVVFFHSEEQACAAVHSREWAQGFFPREIVTEIVPAGEFWPAEEYHQKYFEKNGGHGCHVRRKFGRDGSGTA